MRLSFARAVFSRPSRVLDLWLWLFLRFGDVCVCVCVCVCVAVCGCVWLCVAVCGVVAPLSRPAVRRHACPYPREAERYRAPDGVPPSHEHLAITAVGPGEVSLCWPMAPNQGNYTLQATNWWLESSEFTTVYVGARPAATLDASAALPVPIIAGGSYAFRYGWLSGGWPVARAR